MAREKKEVFGVTIDGDISGLRRAMYEAEALFKSTERSLKNVQKQAELEPTNAGVLMKQMHMYKKAAEDARGAVDNLQKKLHFLEEEARKLKLFDTVKYKTEFTQMETEIKLMVKTAEEFEKKYKSLGSVPMQVFEGKLKKFYSSFTDSFQMFDRLKESVKDFDRILELDPSDVETFAQRQAALNALYEQSQATLIRYREELENIRKAYGYSPEVELRPEVVALKKDIAQLVDEGERFKRMNISYEASSFNKQLEKTSQSLIDIGNATSGLSRMFRGFLTSSFEASKSYETSIANIKRVISDLSESSIEDLKTMAVETGTAFDQIADYATISGSLGLAGDEVTEFTKAMIDLNTATGGVFNGEEGAKGIAVFLKQMGLGTEEAENFGSAVVEIGRRYADIGDETVNIATKMTALSAVIDTNQYELLGLAGVMADIGLSADTNANAINRSFLQIDKILSGGVKDADSKLQLLAKTAGMTSEQFRDAWGKNAMNAFLTFVDGLRSSVFNDINSSIERADGTINQYAETLGWTADQFQRAWGEDSKKVLDMYIEALGELGEDGESASSVLSGIGLSSVFTAQTLLRLAGSGNEVRDAIELVNDAWSRNTALQESAQNIYDTTERKLQGLFESLKQLGGSLVDNFTPTIKDMVDNFTVLAQNVGKMSPAMQKLVTYFVAFGAGLSPVAKGLGELGLWFVKNSKGVSKFSRSMDGLKTLITGPGGVIGAIGLAVTALAWADGVVKDNDALGNLKDRVGELKDNLLETSKVADENFRQSMSGLFDGADEYIAKIQELIEINKDKSLPWSERNDARKQIEEYVSALNSIVGDEVYVFDSATGELRTQEEIIDDLKKSFSEYKFEIEKQNWLDAHKEELQQAQEALAQTSEEMQKATEDYVSHTQSVPQWVLDLLAENKGDVSALAEELQKQGFNGTDATSWIDTLERFFPSYQEAMQKADAVQKDAQRYIDKYNEVQTSSLENFNAIIGEIEKIPETVQPNFDYTLTTTEELTKQREALSTALGNDLATTNLLIQAYDQEIEKAPILSNWLQEQFETAAQAQEKANTMMEELDAWAIEPLEKQIKFAVDWSNSAPAWMWGQIPYASNGSRSGGYGSFRENIVQSALNPGMYRSGGVTVNANFNITNGNNIDRYTVREWGETIGEAINEYLGTQM